MQLFLLKGCSTIVMLITNSFPYGIVQNYKNPQKYRMNYSLEMRY